MRTISKLLCLLSFVLCFNFAQAQSEVQRVRIDFENPDGYTRHLLLGFVTDNSATDGFDYGYDALNIDDLPDDLNWMIEDNRYVIQGVGEFNTSKYYPLGMFLSNTGDISISLAELENFNQDIDVYLYDYQEDSYTLLNASSFDENLTADTYLDRFYITFSTSAHLTIASNSLLSTDDNEISDLKIWHSKQNDKLYVKGIKESNDTSVAVYNIEGKKLSDVKISNLNYAIDTSEMSTGIYMVKINSDTISHTRKVCITN
jgi:hypothetical protein